MAYNPAETLMAKHANNLRTGSNYDTSHYSRVSGTDRLSVTAWRTRCVKEIEQFRRTRRRGGLAAGVGPGTKQCNPLTFAFTESLVVCLLTQFLCFLALFHYTVQRSQTHLVAGFTGMEACEQKEWNVVKLEGHFSSA